MASKTDVGGKCMDLSPKVMSLGVGINSKRGAQELFRELCAKTTELGAGISAVNYLPTRSMRAQQAVELVKCCQQVIYLLNLALREGSLEQSGLSGALTLAVDIGNEINNFVMAYVPGVAAAQPEEKPEEQPEDEQPRPDPDPDGFDAPYDGSL